MGKTTLMNNVGFSVQVVENNSNIFRILRVLKPGDSMIIQADSKATYREYVLNLLPDNKKLRPLSANDIQELPAIEIFQDDEPNKFDWRELPGGAEDRKWRGALIGWFTGKQGKTRKGDQDGVGNIALGEAPAQTSAEPDTALGEAPTQTSAEPDTAPGEAPAQTLAEPDTAPGEAPAQTSAEPDTAPSEAPTQTSAEPDIAPGEAPAQTLAEPDTAPREAPTQTSTEPNTVPGEAPAQTSAEPNTAPGEAPALTSAEPDTAPREAPAQTSAELVDTAPWEVPA